MVVDDDSDDLATMKSILEKENQKSYEARLKGKVANLKQKNLVE